MNDLILTAHNKEIDVYRLLNFDNKLSLNTCKTYTYLLTKFKRDFLDLFDIDFDQVSKQTIIDYMAFLKEQGRKNTSINNSIKALKRFYNTMIDKGLADHNPVDGVAYFKESQVDKTNKYKWLDEKTLKAIFQELKQDQSEIGLRNYALFYFMVFTGLRASEVCNLKFSDIIYVDDRPSEIRFTGKGDKERTVDIDPDIMAHILNYRACTGLKNDPESNIFLTSLSNAQKSRKPMNRHSLFYIIKQIGKRNGIVNLHPHKLRHTNITHLLKGGCPIHRVSDHAGHSGVNITASIYCHDDSPVQPFMDGLKAIA